MSTAGPRPTPVPAASRNTRTVYRVCFVCTGNICRSPMAESVLRARIGEAGLDGSVAVDSAGTGGWHVGDAADPRTVRVLSDHGYSSRHTARRFEHADFARRDLIVALDSGHLRTLRALAPEGAAARLHLLRAFDPAAGPGRLDVPDPYYGSLAGFEECLAMVESAMPGLMGHIRTALETRTG